jgi:hypothetical protein
VDRNEDTPLSRSDVHQLTLLRSIQGGPTGVPDEVQTMRIRLKADQVVGTVSYRAGDEAEVPRGRFVEKLIRAGIAESVPDAATPAAAPLPPAEAVKVVGPADPGTAAPAAEPPVEAAPPPPSLDAIKAAAMKPSAKAAPAPARPKS